MAGSVPCPDGCRCRKHARVPAKAWRASAEHQRNHKRVRRTFGKASEYQCYLCFDRARDWAHMWRTHSDKADPESYIPLCRQDHVDYDYEQVGGNQHWRADASIRALRQWSSPEFRATWQRSRWPAKIDN